MGRPIKGEKMKAFISYVAVKDITPGIQTFEYGNSIENDFDPSEGYIGSMEKGIANYSEPGAKVTILNIVLFK